MKIFVRKYENENPRRARVEIELHAEAAEVEYPDEIGKAIQLLMNLPDTETTEH